MGAKIAVPSSLISPKSDRPLTPAMVTVLWQLGAVLDEQRVPAEVVDAVWLEVQTSRLRGAEGRSDNVWLRECLERLLSTKISGSYRGQAWGAVVVAEYQFTQGGSVVRLLVPPAAIRAIRAPSTFAKIEVDAAHQLPPHARALYAILADKKHMSQNWWVFPLSDLKEMLGVLDKKAYDRWSNFKSRVIDSAVEAINAYGTVQVTVSPQKLGKVVNSVRFDWRWKTLDEARETLAQGERHSVARGREAEVVDAPPLVVAPEPPTPPVEMLFPSEGSIEDTPFASLSRQFIPRCKADTLAEMYRHESREAGTIMNQKGWVSFLLKESKASSYHGK